jgi:hypothetical protein
VRVPLFKDHPSLRSPARPLSRVLVILAPTEADVRSIRALWHEVRRLGIALFAATECHGEVMGEHDHILNPNLLLIEAAVCQWDACIVAGGAGALRVAEDPLARAIVHSARHVAAFGLGRVVVERAGADGFATDSVDAMAAWLLLRVAAQQRGATVEQHGEDQTGA